MTAPGISLRLDGVPGAGTDLVFAAMAHRLHRRRHAGAVGALLGPDPARVEQHGADPHEVTRGLLDAFAAWRRVEPPTGATWRLELGYRAGWLGGAVHRLEVEHRRDDHPQKETGEETGEVPDTLELLTMSLWTLFPRRVLEPDHAEEASQQRARLVERLSRDAAPSMLLLTWAEDSRADLPELQEAWIHRPRDGHARHLERLHQRGPRLAYLANARRVSDYLHRHLEHTAPEVAELLGQPGRRPWLLPLSAADPRVLARVAEGASAPETPPAPVHVELPILLALCGKAGALL